MRRAFLVADGGGDERVEMRQVEAVGIAVAFERGVGREMCGDVEETPFLGRCREIEVAHRLVLRLQIDDGIRLVRFVA